MSYPLLAKRREIMEQTAKKIGVEFVFVNAPDPTARAESPVPSSSSLKCSPPGGKVRP